MKARKGGSVLKLYAGFISHSRSAAEGWLALSEPLDRMT
jgi:hypothetical protein